MNTAATPRAPDVHPAEPLASWYMPGMIDGFGDRLLMIDNAASDALELLRFRAALVATEGFEETLHERVRQLRRLAHTAFPNVRGIERLERDGALVLVSTSTPGQRLSGFLDERQSGIGLHPAFVMWVASQVLEAIAVLHAESDDVAHSALTADRIILAPDGRVRVVEHVLGAALRHLGCSPERLWREFGILVPRGGEGRPRLDGRGDVFQLGVMALSMLLARRITRSDVDYRLASLLEQWSETSGAQWGGGPLRRWLERALQIGDRPYDSAAEARAGLRELPAVSASSAFELLQAGSADSKATLRLMPPLPTPTSGQEAQTAMRLSIAAVMPPVAPRWRVLRAATGIVLVAAMVEAIVIAALLVRQPRERAQTGDGAPSPILDVPRDQVQPTTGEGPALGSDMVSLTPRPAGNRGGSAHAVAGGDLARRNLDGMIAAITQAARNRRSGGVRLSAPIELMVLQGDRVLGSSADGPIVTSAGTHDLELINASLGFRTRRAVTFPAGEITTLTVPVPPGRISVNATPWAEVWIDGRQAGETPLANLEVALGEHELVLRHPDLGERRQRIVVRADTVARVSTTFDR